MTVNEAGYEVPTLSRVRELAAKAADNAGPGFKYPDAERRMMRRELGSPVMTCQYAVLDEATEQPRPSCLVGHVLADLGVPVERLLQFPDHDVTQVLWALYDRGCAEGSESGSVGESFEGRARSWLVTVQQLQDQGFSWDRAIELADDPNRAARVLSALVEYAEENAE